MTHGQKLITDYPISIPQQTLADILHKTNELIINLISHPDMAHIVTHKLTQIVVQEIPQGISLKWDG